MTENGEWEPSEVVAWTERDGPGRPPGGPLRLLSVALVLLLVGVLVGVMSTDTLCPEHRAWVDALAAISMVGVLIAAAGLLRGNAGAPFAAIVSAAAGIAVGLIDMTHDATRGRTVALAFGCAAALGIVVAALQLRIVAWDKKALRRTVHAPPIAGTVDSPSSVEPEGVAVAVEPLAPIPR